MLVDGTKITKKIVPIDSSCYFCKITDVLMTRLMLTLSALLMLTSTAVAERVVVFNPACIWPEPVCIEMPGFGPMPTGYYIIDKDDVEVEFQMDDEMENEHDAYYYRGKMNIYSTRYGIKMVTFTCPQTCADATFSLLYESNYQYTQTTIPLADEDGGIATVFEFFDTYREYVGLEGSADIWTIAVTLDDDESTRVPEAPVTREVAQVKYFNMAGQEIAQPSGLTIRLSTYTDGSTSVEKLVK
jgi:hypothetical protein